MGKAKQITPRKRAIVAQYFKDDLKQSEICKRLCMNKATVSLLIKKLRTTGSITAGKSTGRKRVTSARDDHRIRRSASTHPNFSSLQIKVDADVAASSRTVRRRLYKDFGLRARRPAKKPFLTKIQRKKRLAFCRKYLNWTPDQWSRVMFSDEAAFAQFGVNTSFVYRPRGQRYNPKFTCPTMKHSPKTLVWGCFSAAGRGALYFVDQKKMVNADEYLKILDSKLILSMQLHSSEVFQHDSAPAHAAKKVKQWLAANGVQVLDWPGNSPDLNPIENLWMILKRKVRLQQPQNLQDLIHCIKRSWCMEISTDVCKRLATSMPQRLKTVINNKGFASKY
jgi:transposase